MWPIAGLSAGLRGPSGFLRIPAHRQGMRAHNGIGDECKPISGLGRVEPGGQGGIGWKTKE
ncbi:MAG TPA: hypothetical protein DCX71_07680 [Erythrobacter sp.]|nr:hypothetical protein A3718_12000 [Erythrobacter sp. HI0019]KZY09794.1 hypothetical protein A3723_08925 [Erythrobacter sp. HI0028]KZY94986.1 hypothetical protein A3745_08555 [Erythrobacter sp. HI0074]KZZ06978.1 hypothetical protein A3748_03285 [Erythrobacter sp. HI0077]MAL53663.1 hypothetical protein [Sphingomonadaceae bacterium]HAL90872.1 hypothetical protein [Erythrobacter sp.]